MTKDTIVGTTFVAQMVPGGSYRPDLPDDLYALDANGIQRPLPLVLEISQTDAAGNENRVTETITVIVDVIPPERDPVKR